MKAFISIALFLVSVTVIAQSTNDSITFAAHKLLVPAGCKVEGATKVRCDKNKIDWTYGDRKKVQGLEDAFLEMGDMFGQFKKKRTNFYLLNTKVKGYIVSYKNAAGTAYQISATGVVNGAPVWVLLTLDKEPTANSDLPEFAQQIIRFENEK